MYSSQSWRKSSSWSYSFLDHCFPKLKRNKCVRYLTQKVTIFWVKSSCTHKGNPHSFILHVFKLCFVLPLDGKWCIAAKESHTSPPELEKFGLVQTGQSFFRYSRDFFKTNPYALLTSLSLLSLSHKSWSSNGFEIVSNDVFFFTLSQFL